MGSVANAKFLKKETKAIKAMAKSLKQAKQSKTKKSGKASSTVNNNIRSVKGAPAAIGTDFQTFYKEERFQKMHKGKLKDAIRVSGCEYLGPILVPAAEAAGSVYGEYYLSPAEFAGTRLELYARLYEKFLFTQMDFEYLPAVGSETAGQLVIAHDRDISDATPPANQQGVRMFLAMEDMRAGNVWQPHTAKCPLRSEEDGFFCNPVIGGDDRLAYQGQVYVACVAPTGVAQGSTLGTLLIRYTCEFFIPQLENQLNIGNVASQSEELDPINNNTGVLDLLKMLSENSSLSGLIQYLPKLQADGTYAITVPEGLFDWAISVFGGVFNNGGSAATVTIAPLEVEVLEPQPAPAPQAQVETILGISTTQPAGISGMYPGAYRAYVNVPRGGARLRQKLNFTGGVGSTTNTTGPYLSATFQRLGSVVQSLLNLFPEPTPRMVAKSFPKGHLTWQTLRRNARKPEATSPAEEKKCFSEPQKVAPAALPEIPSPTLGRSVPEGDLPYCEYQLLIALQNLGMSAPEAVERMKQIVRK